MKFRKKAGCMLIALVLACTLLFGACGKVVDSNDDGKQIIFISVYDGGTGTEWVETLAEKWSSENEKYKIEIIPEKTSDVVSRVEAGETATSPAAYFLVGIETSLKYSNKLEDLSDILEMEVDGEGNGTIGDKLGRTEDYRKRWDEVASRFGEGYYALPYADSLAGWVYDHDTFLEMGWLNLAPASAAADALEDGIQTQQVGNTLIVTGDYDYYDSGDKLLTAGKDGVYGTYDDGQPTTVAEWNDMINKIVKVDNKRAFIWSAANKEYIDSMIWATAFQYAGIDAFNAFTYRDSGDMEIELHNDDGTTRSKVIKVDTGYEFYQMEALYQAYKFAGENLLVSANVNPSSEQGSTNHTETQGRFLLGYREEDTAPLTAMLFDGIWWENEARPVFTSIEKNPEDKETRGFGKRDYRYMLYPNFDGQVGIDGNGHGTVFSCMDSGSIIVPKSADREKVAAVKDFIAYTLTDENLRFFTRETGVMRAYKYELTDEDKAQMTPFSRTVWDIYADTENIAIIRPMVADAASPFVNLGGLKTAGHFVSKINNIQYNTAIHSMQQSKSYEAAFKGLSTYIADFDWALYVENARNYGYYL